MSNMSKTVTNFIAPIVVAVIVTCITTHFTANRQIGQQVILLTNQVSNLEKDVTAIHSVLKDLEIVATIQANIQNNSKAIAAIQEQQSIVLNQLTDIIVNDTKAAERIAALREEIRYLKKSK